MLNKKRSVRDWERVKSMCCKIEDVALAVQREPLRKPLGFKGGFLKELWQPVCRIRAADGTYGVGIGVQSVLWADAGTFAVHTPTGSNAMMLAVTEYALQMLKGTFFEDPIQTQHELFETLHEYAQRVTNNRNLSKTFTLNSLVPVDLALWQLWAAQNGSKRFEDITQNFCPRMNFHQEKLGLIPLISYNTSEAELRKLLDAGAFLLKIKIGSNPGERNNLDEMCVWDIERVTRIHAIASEYHTPYTECGHPVYYLDANGRYDTPERLERFLAGAALSGALDRIVLLEEPFPVEADIPVHRFPVRIAADERIHCTDDAVRCIDKLGYTAIALKPIAKTLSATLEIYHQAQQRGVPCFCADLTVPPVMLDWNMNVAARIKTLPGLHIGVVESNGAQNYTQWERLVQMHPTPDAAWLRTEKGVFCLRQFYERCTAFCPADQYEALLDEK